MKRVRFYDENYEFRYGEVDLLRKGEELTILTYGSFTHIAVEASDILRKDGIKISVIGVPSPLCFDIKSFRKYIEGKIVLTLEDHNVNSGLANELSRAMIEILYIPNLFNH